MHSELKQSRKWSSPWVSNSTANIHMNKLTGSQSLAHVPVYTDPSLLTSPQELTEGQDHGSLD
jgi:hypothetical protein